MKIAAIGDIHGETFWKKVNPEDYDRIVFIGDYFDSFHIKGKEQIRNYLDIIRLKKDNPDKVILLLGNHDIHYCDGINERYSGFQNGISYTYNQLLESNMEHHQMSYEWGKYLFTHAGVSSTWMDNWNAKVPEDINELWKYQRRAFQFQGLDIYGDDVTQSPVWIRPNSLISDKFEHYIQVVGHTTQEDLVYRDGVHIIDNRAKNILNIKT